MIDNAVNAFSPPDNKFIEVSFFPGGLAYTTTPVFKRSFSVIFKYAFPPLNNFGKINTITYGVTLGDFNGDGWLDMVTANSGSENIIYYNSKKKFKS